MFAPTGGTPRKRPGDARARKPSRKSLVEDYLRLHHPAEVNAAMLAELRRFVSERLASAAVSDRYLLDLVEHTPTPISRELGGLPLDLRDRVHFHDFAAAETSLRDLEREYEAARAADDRERVGDCRRAVLRGRQRLEMLLRQRSLSDAKRAEKQEILGWFRVWLENTALFPTWIDLRKRALAL